MKRILISSIFLLCALFTASAQLNIKSTNSVSERFYKDTWATVTWNGSAFMFNSSDPTTALTLSFTLGKDKTSALTTLQQIYDWFESAENKTSITFEDDGNEITLYKQDGMQIIITTGDAEFARKEYNRRLSGALVGTMQYKKKESTPHLSFIIKKALVRSIEAISALADPKYGVTPVEESIVPVAEPEPVDTTSVKKETVEIPVQETVQAPDTTKVQKNTVPEE